MLKTRALYCAIFAALTLMIDACSGQRQSLPPVKQGTRTVTSLGTQFAPTTLQGATLALSPIAYFRADETADTALLDSSTTAANATYFGSGVTLNAPPLTVNDTGSSSYDGVSGYATLAAATTTALYTASNAFSVSFWFRLNAPPAAGTNPRYIANGHTDWSDPGSFQIAQLGTNIVFHVRQSGGGLGEASYPLSPVVGTIYHVVGTYSGTYGAGSQAIYVNAVAGTVTKASTGGISAPAFPIGIGYNPAYSGDYANAAISEVSLYTKVLAAADVTNLYNAGTTASPSLVYTNSAPGRGYPIAVSALPTPPALTFAAQVLCRTTTSGSTIFSALSGYVVETGLCDGGTNPTNATGAHIYNFAGNAQSVPPTGLSAGVQYTIVATQSRVSPFTLAYYACPFPNGTCVKAPTAVGAPLTYGGTTGYIGGSDATTRAFNGDIWNIRIYDGAFNDSDVQAIADAGVADPYSAGVPAVSAASTAYNMTNPPPAGWPGPFSSDYGFNPNAPNASRINWDALYPQGDPPDQPDATSFLRAVTGVLESPTQLFHINVGTTAGYTSTHQAADAFGVTGTRIGDQYCGSQINNTHCDESINTYFVDDTAANVHPYTIHCVISYGDTAHPCASSAVGPDGVSNMEGSSIPMPDGIYGAFNGDHHLTIINEKRGYLCDFWRFEEGNSDTPNYDMTGLGLPGSIPSAGQLNIARGGCAALTEKLDGNNGRLNTIAISQEQAQYALRAEDLLANSMTQQRIWVSEAISMQCPCGPLHRPMVVVPGTF